MTGLNTKTEDLQATLNVMVERLDTIITLLGGAPPTETVTLEDLLLVLQDIHTDTMSMDGKLLTIRNTLKDPTEGAIEDDTPSIAYNVYRIRRSVATNNLPVPEHSNIHSIVYSTENIINSLLSISNTHLGNTYQVLSKGLANLGLNIATNSYDYAGWLATSANLIAKIQGGIGVPFDGGNRNVIELLARMLDRPLSQIGSGLPPTEMCIDAYISSGMVLVPAVSDPYWPALVYAKWPDPPPTGIEFGSVFGFGDDYTELVNTSGDWSGYRVYVASSADNFGMYIGVNVDASLARYPTNVWVDIGFYEEHLSIFVPGDASLRAYLCGDGWGGGGGSGGPWEELPPDGGGTWEDCIEIASASTVVTHPNSAVTSITYTPMSMLPGVEYSDTLPVDGGAYVTTANDSIAVGNFNGVTITLLSAETTVRAYYQRADLSFNVHTFSGMGDTFSIAEDTVRMAIDTFTGGATPDYTVEICPPT